MYEPNKKYAVKSISGPIPLEAHYTLEPAKDGTRIEGKREVEMKHFFKFVTPIMAFLLRDEYNIDIAKLKRLLETH